MLIIGATLHSMETTNNNSGYFPDDGQLVHSTYGEKISQCSLLPAEMWAHINEHMGSHQWVIEQMYHKDVPLSKKTATNIVNLFERQAQIYLTESKQPWYVEVKKYFIEIESDKEFVAKKQKFLELFEHFYEFLKTKNEKNYHCLGEALQRRAKKFFPQVRCRTHSLSSPIVFEIPANNCHYQIYTLPEGTILSFKHVAALICFAKSCCPHKKTSWRYPHDAKVIKGMLSPVACSGTIVKPQEADLFTFKLLPLDLMPMDYPIP